MANLNFFFLLKKLDKMNLKIIVQIKFKVGLNTVSKLTLTSIRTRVCFSSLLEIFSNLEVIHKSRISNI